MLQEISTTVQITLSSTTSAHALFIVVLQHHPLRPQTRSRLVPSLSHDTLLALEASKPTGGTAATRCAHSAPSATGTLPAAPLLVRCQGVWRALGLPPLALRHREIGLRLDTRFLCVRQAAASAWQAFTTMDIDMTCNGCSLLTPRNEELLVA